MRHLFEDYNNYESMWIEVTNGHINIRGIVEEEDSYWDDEEEEEVVDYETIEVDEILYDADPVTLDVLKQAIEDDPTVSREPGLAAYVDEDFSEIKNIVIENIFKMKDPEDIATLFRIDVDLRHAQHTREEIEEYLKDYLIGQCSDGWGEGFEQRSFWQDPEGDGCDYYFSPWSRESEAIVDKN